MVDSVERFTATVADYVKYRPGYPDELFSFLQSVTTASSSLRSTERVQIEVVELGAGTGIFTRQLAAKAFVKRICAVEPNDSMRQAAVNEHFSSGDVNVSYVQGTAERTGLPSASADIVLGAQCFHWFDLSKALPEIERIGRPGAWCFAIWNDRVEEGFNRSLERILLEFSKPYATLRRPDGTIQDLKHRIPSGTEVAFDYKQDLPLESLIGRMASTSYVTHGVDDMKSFNAALTEAFHRHQRAGVIEMLYQTRVFYWRLPLTSNL